MEKDFNKFTRVGLIALGDNFFLFFFSIFSSDNGIAPGKGGKGTDCIQQCGLR